MKKILSLLLIGLLCASPAFATYSNYESDNIVILGPNMGAKGITPPTEIVKVRYAMRDHYGSGSANATSLNSGDCVIWSINSSDGYTITACISDEYQAANPFAGILVTAIETATSSAVRGRGRNVGYMATRGYCLARMDTSSSFPGAGIEPNGATLIRSCRALEGISPDIGWLLEDVAADGLMPVYLR